MPNMLITYLLYFNLFPKEEPAHSQILLIFCIIVKCPQQYYNFFTGIFVNLIRGTDLLSRMFQGSTQLFTIFNSSGPQVSKIYDVMGKLFMWISGSMRSVVLSRNEMSDNSPIRKKTCSCNCNKSHQIYITHLIIKK